MNTFSRYEVTKEQHLLAIELLEKLGLEYLKLQPNTRGGYRYHGWTVPPVADNGAPKVVKRGTVRTRR